MMNKINFENDVQILYFLEALRKKEILVWADTNKIRYRSNVNRVDSDILSILKNNKFKILSYYQMIKNNGISLTPIQSAYILGQQAGCELADVNAHYYIEYEVETLDIQYFEKSLNKVILNNDALRMIVTHDQKLSFLENVPYYSITQYDLKTKEDRLQTRKYRSHKKYCIYQWPMFNFSIGKSDEQNDVLHIDFDCIILDAWSAKQMIDEIFSLYCHKNVCFPELTFLNYLKLKDNVEDFKAKDYWEKQTEIIPSYPKLNFKKKFSEVTKIKFKRLEYNFSVNETKQIYVTIKNNHFTIAAVIATIFMKSLSYYSENSSLAINVTLFNRQAIHKDVNNILGEFTNNAVIYFQDNTTFLQSVKDTQKQLWKIIQYRKYDGTKILKSLATGKPGKAVMPIVFTSMVNGEGNLSKQHNYPFKETFAISQTPQVILDHHVRDDLGYLKISWDYVVDIFDEQLIKEIFGTYIVNIKKLVNNKMGGSK